jgi:hypothetical protein
MNQRYIITSGGLYGHYGSGATLTEATAKWKKAGGKTKEGNYRVQRFTSKLPFAPTNREATEHEADCWIGRDGSTNWVRCEREVLEG